jgi:hypothetical protein
MSHTDRKENTMTMQRILTFPLLLGLVLMAGAAYAVTLFTPPLVPNGNNQLDCYLVNVSDRVREATIEVRNRDGEVLKSVAVTLDPGTEEVASVEADEQPRYCKIASSTCRVRGRTFVLLFSCGSRVSGPSAPCRPSSTESDGLMMILTGAFTGGFCNQPCAVAGSALQGR